VAKAPLAAKSTTKEAAKESVLRLSFNELTSNPRRYEGKRVAVTEGLTLYVQTWNEARHVSVPGAVFYGSPYNPRCEYSVTLIPEIGGALIQERVKAGLRNSVPRILGCVPRSKVGNLGGAWNGAQNVRFIGTVAPAPWQEPNQLVSVRDVEIILPPQNTDERWPDERRTAPPRKDVTQR
jgi:hypothetical protein